MAKPTKAAGKVAGMAKQAAAKLSGQHGILNTLQKEHGEVSTLMQRVAATKAQDDGISDREELFEKIAIELLSHAKAEEQEFYTVMERHPETSARAKSSNLEHRDIERRIHELDSIRYADAEWMPKFEELMNIVMEHVDQEENEFFPLAMDVLSKEDLKRMDQLFMREKQKQKESLEGTRDISRGGAAESHAPGAE